MKPGDYVRCNFPFREVRGPGPSPHIVLCLFAGRDRGIPVAIVAYTTTRVEIQGRRRPRQHILVDAARAEELGQQKSFHVDVSRVARLPLTPDYFPDLKDGMIPTFGRDPNFVKTVIARQQELMAAGFPITPIALHPGTEPKP